MLWITVVIAFLASFSAKLLADTFLRGHVDVLGSFAGLQFTENPGIAFGVTFPTALQTLLILCALVAVLMIALRSARTRLQQIAFGCILGGALANLFDRARDGLVTDFFQVGTFPVFNVADSCITVGAVLLLIGMLAANQRG